MGCETKSYVACALMQLSDCHHILKSHWLLESMIFRGTVRISRFCTAISTAAWFRRFETSIRLIGSFGVTMHSCMFLIRMSSSRMSTLIFYNNKQRFASVNSVQVVRVFAD